MEQLHVRQWAAVLFFLYAGAWVSASQVPPSYAGNLEMVEERTEELDELNRQAVNQIPEELPEDGQIELKADLQMSTPKLPPRVCSPVSVPAATLVPV